MKRQIFLIAHNLRSAHNVGSILRTAEGLGIDKVILTGYTPYPRRAGDERLPHLADKLHRQIEKTALGASVSQPWEYQAEITNVIADLKEQRVQVMALEQVAGAQQLPQSTLPTKVAFVVGREVEGLEAEVVAACDQAIEIPMTGQKESFNVSVAAAMALYQARYF